MPEWLIAFLIALLPFGTLVEYWGHRLMHTILLKKKHAEHHRDGWGQGWLGEFWDYFSGTIYILPLGFICGWLIWGLGPTAVEVGIGFAAGGVSFCAFAAYSHQLQHERPELCFWMVRPVHFIHHNDHMWKTNFGISCDIWDRVFGTYRKGDWDRSKIDRPWSFRGLFTIKWI